MKYHNALEFVSGEVRLQFLRTWLALAGLFCFMKRPSNGNHRSK
jgi:hypothetical protein